MQRFWDQLVRVFAAGLLAGVLLLSVLSSQSPWWPTARVVWWVCAVGLLVALYFSRRLRSTDESYGPDPGDRSDHSDD